MTDVSYPDCSGRSYILCEVCQQFHTEMWHGKPVGIRPPPLEDGGVLGYDAGGIAADGGLGYALPPEFLPAPLATMEGERLFRAQQFTRLCRNC